MNKLQVIVFRNKKNMNTTKVSNLVNIFYDHADERIRDEFLMGSPFKIVAIYLCYVVIVTKILPKLAENWKPINYNKYTFIHVLILYTRSFYFVFNNTYLWFNEYNWRCQACSPADSLLSILEVKLAHEFVITKFIYTIQSFIVILSKRSDEYTTYVWIHHSVFPLLLWTCVNYYPGGHTLFIHYINALEHFSQMSIQLVYLIFSLRSMRQYLKPIYIFMHVRMNYGYIRLIKCF